MEEAYGEGMVAEGDMGKNIVVMKDRVSME